MPAKPARRPSRKPHNDKAVPHLWQLASQFAARQHRHQIRKDGLTPYFSHVVRVAFTVSQLFGCHDEVVVCMALLHDTIEDTTTDYDDLESNFGSTIADGVAALTKNMALKESEREAEYDARLAKADWRVRLVKLADTYDNFCDCVNHPAHLVEEKRLEAIDKCRRAISLARHDAADNPSSARAIRLVEALIKPYAR